MTPLEDFEQHLQAALSCLYNPAHRPSQVVWLVLDVSPLRGIEALWKALIGAIGELQPEPELPPTARLRRVYDLLSLRYVHSLTQEAAAERLGISPRHLRREQAGAVHVLAERLWSSGRPEVGQPHPAPETPDTYLSQVRQELESLRHRARDSTTDVGAAVSSVAALGRDLAARQGITIEFSAVPPGLMAAIHPSALRQVLLAAISAYAERMPAGRIELGAERIGRCVRVLLEGQPVTGERLPDITFIDEIMSWSGGSAESHLDGDTLHLSLALPVADPVKVIVLDDNEDMVHFFRRYVAGTRYTIVAAPDAHELLELVEQTSAAVIVLDVMLPDVDGWDVLMHLHAQPETSGIPVIVCSVVRERELALSLGAAGYLPKPVRRQDFIRALDQALVQAAAGTERCPESIPRPC